MSINQGDLFPNLTKKIDIFVRLDPAVPTFLYNNYWMFAAERQNIFFARYNKQVPPWTNDPILRTYKFTNAYRASDRVSQYLIKNVIYCGDQSLKEVFFRIMLFKLFNKIETWELLLSELKEISATSFSFSAYDLVLTKALEKGKTIYSAAYIMPSRGVPCEHTKKHRIHLELIKVMLKDHLPERIQSARSMQTVFELLKAYPGIGDFLAFQYAIDINYSDITDFDEMDFVVPGPGAKNGIKKCFHDLGGLNETEIIKFVTERQQIEFERLGIEFKSLWGRALQLIDCQNIFCEIDKYARGTFPELTDISGRSRIKQKFSMKSGVLSYWYPPKWKINELITKDMDTER